MSAECTGSVENAGSGGKARADKKPAGYVLAFDFGERHIGVAVGQGVTGTASPLATLRARNGRPDADELAQLIGHWRPSALIVGLPLNMDDTESAMSARARSFATRLARTTGLPVHLVDERLSSREAQGRTRELQAHRARERAKPTRDGATTHARAAQLIAETYYSGGAIETVPSGRSGGQRR